MVIVEDACSTSLTAFVYNVRRGLKRFKNLERLVSLECLERFENLECLEHLERFENLEYFEPIKGIERLEIYSDAYTPSFSFACLKKDGSTTMRPLFSSITILFFRPTST